MSKLHSVAKTDFEQLNKATSANMQSFRSTNLKLDVFKGIKRAIPIVLCYFPVSFAFGVLASQAGLSALEALTMGIMVYAGSGQFVGVGLLAAGASIPNIVFTIFIINLRHLLMSAAVSSYLATWPRLSQLLFAYEMTDESFAVHISHFGQERNKNINFVPTRAETLALNFTAHSSWFMGGFLGALFGDILGEVKQYGFDFALAGMFISLVVPLLVDKLLRTVAILAGLTSVALILLGETQWNVMLATILAASIGAMLPSEPNSTSSASQVECGQSDNGANNDLNKDDVN